MYRLTHSPTSRSIHGAPNSYTYARVLRSKSKYLGRFVNQSFTATLAHEYEYSEEVKGGGSLLLAGPFCFYRYRSAFSSPSALRPMQPRTASEPRGSMGTAFFWYSSGIRWCCVPTRCLRVCLPTMPHSYRIFYVVALKPLATTVIVATGTV